MRYTTFGRHTGLRVSEYALGTAMFGTTWSTGADRATSQQIFDRFAEAGGTFVDTSDSYQFGESESLIGEFLKTDREHFVLASKFTQGATAKAGVSETGNSRKTMVRALEGSLRRLDTDYLDVYWAHWPDTVTPMEEIVATFDALVRAGKILHGGLSNFPAWRIAHGATIAQLRGWAPLVGMQIEYSLVERTAERDLLPMADALGVGAVLYSPLGGGLLTGKYRRGEEGRLDTWNVVIHTEDTDQKAAVVDSVVAVATELGVAPSYVAMAFLAERSHRAATPLVRIVGPRTLQQLDDYLAALDVTLSPDQYERLDRVSAPVLGYPHDLIAKNLPDLLGGVSAGFDRPLPVA